MEVLDQTLQDDFVLRAARMASWDWDLRSHRMKWSAEHYRMLGYESADFEPTLDHLRMRMHPADWVRFEEALRSAVEKRTGYEAQYRVCWPDQSIHWLQARG